MTWFGFCIGQEMNVACIQKTVIGEDYEVRTSEAKLSVWN